MADEKWTARPTLAGASVADSDTFGFVDVSDTTQDPTGSFKQLTKLELAAVFTRVLVPTAKKTAAYTAAAGDLVLVNAATANVPITLPTAPLDRTPVGVKVVGQTGAFVGQVITGGTDVFTDTSGATQRDLQLNQQLMLQYQASAGVWHIISDDAGGTLIDSADFRPDPTGTADATARINAMLTAAVGRQCVLRKGTYKVLSPILCPSNTNLFIEPGTTIQADPGNTVVGAIDSILQNTNAVAGTNANITITAYGAVFDGFKANSQRVAGAHNRGLWFGSVTGLQLYGMKVQNVEDHGIQITDCLDFEVRGATVSAAGKTTSSAGGSGIAISCGTADANRGMIANCFCINNLRCGIKIGTNAGASTVDLPEPVDVIDCKATGNGIDTVSPGFAATGPVGAANLFWLRGVNYTNCQAWSNQSGGFDINTGLKGLTLTGCQAWNNQKYGFMLFQGAIGCAFLGCQAWSNSQAASNTYDGFFIDSTSVACTDNVFIGCASYDDGATPKQRWGWFETNSIVNTRNRVIGGTSFGNLTGHVSMNGHPNTPIGGGSVVPLFEDHADVGTTTAASEDTLHSHTLPAALFANDGDALQWIDAGTFANNTRTKRVRVRFGASTGSIVGDTGAMTFTGSATDNWRAELTVVRVSSTVFRCTCEFKVNGATVGAQPSYTELTGQVAANTQAIRTTGQISASGVANDIVARVGRCTFFRAP